MEPLIENCFDSEVEPSITLMEEEVMHTQTWLIRLRWIAGVSALFATWLAQVWLKLEVAALPLYAGGVMILAYNGLLFWLRSLMERKLAQEPGSCQPCNLARIQIALDWLAMIWLVHFSGGIESPLLLYFFFHITLAAIMLPTRDVYIFASLATALVSGLTLAEYRGLLPHIPVKGLLPTPLYQHPQYLFGMLFFFTTTLFVLAYLATRTMAYLREQQAQVLALTKRLRHASARRQALYESAQIVSATLDLQDVLDRLTESTREAMGVRACSIRLLDETQTRLRVASASGLSPEYFQKGDLILAENPLARRVLAGEILYVQDVLNDDRLQYPLEAAEAGIRSTLTAPLIGRRGPLGIIRVYCNRVQRFTRDDADFLQAVANHGSIAIENAMAYQTLQNLDEMKRKFVLMVTHELRSPVGVVRSLLRTLTGGYAGPLTPLQQDMLERALRRADFLQTLIDDLLDMASSKSGLHSQKPVSAVNLSALLSRIVERYRVPASEKGLHLTLVLPEEATPQVQANPEELDRAFNNLISNAVKYTPTGGQVTVSLEAADRQWRIAFQDTGIGIPEEALPHLFEEFYRAPNAKAEIKEGTGLGLVITRDIITRYGGRIEVQSRLNEGTTFIVWLPAWNETQPAHQIETDSHS